MKNDMIAARINQLENEILQQKNHVTGDDLAMLGAIQRNLRASEARRFNEQNKVSIQRMKNVRWGIELNNSIIRNAKLDMQILAITPLLLALVWVINALDNESATIAFGTFGALVAVFMVSFAAKAAIKGIKAANSNKKMKKELQELDSQLPRFF